MSGSPVWHPFTQHGLKAPVPLVTHARDALLYTAEGEEIVDAVSSWWVTTHGHCHPRIMDAVREQAGKLDQLIFAGWTHEPAEEVARGLVEMVPDALTRVFFSDSGSTAVEVALKMALGHWAHTGRPRHRLLVLEHSYHGDTIGAMSVGERGVFNAPYAPLLFDVGTIPFPQGDGANTIDALERECAGGAAAFIVEPLVLGAGGMLTYPPHVLKAMREVCARHDVLFIADEVMTGWGRTGTLLACEQAGVVPDILCLAKGITGGSMPLAVTLASEPIFQAHYSTSRETMFYHSSSYTANPLACAAAAANLAIWREEPVLERIAALGEKQQAHLNAAAAAHPNLINTRRCGTITAIDIEDADGGYLSTLSPRLMGYFRERGVLLRPLGNTVYVMPPYSITDAQLDKVWTAIGEAALSVNR
ncbi:adenosylmethionine--8-amino-7-oxononanoate transaminase [Novosphingobium sp. ZN18A2]|uniref:adenosylmethionine--8-amino-7-oxononanoate transaminase n=1 Tax=Novosphingobium sp. ZN18A2 TaxID=3079861 RepID=UPI0030D5FEA4